MISEKTRLRRSRDIVSSDIDGEAVMMSIEKGKYYGMDAIATRIWELMEEPISVAAMVDALTGEFDVTQQDCKKDALAFLHDLLAEKLIEIV